MMYVKISERRVNKETGAITPAKYKWMTQEELNQFKKEQRSKI